MLLIDDDENNIHIAMSAGLRGVLFLPDEPERLAPVSTTKSCHPHLTHLSLFHVCEQLAVADRCARGVKNLRNGNAGARKFHTLCAGSPLHSGSGCGVYMSRTCGQPFCGRASFFLHRLYLVLARRNIPPVQFCQPCYPVQMRRVFIFSSRVCCLPEYFADEKNLSLEKRLCCKVQCCNLSPKKITNPPATQSNQNAYNSLLIGWRLSFRASSYSIVCHPNRVVDFVQTSPFPWQRLLHQPSNDRFHRSY